MTRFAFTLCLAVIGCHFNASGWAPAIDDSKSTLSVTTGEKALSLKGFGFDPAGTVYIDGVKQPSTFVSSAEVDVQLATAITAVSGTHQITFASTNGFVSPPVLLYVSDAAFHLDAVSPTQLDVGREQTLTFNGAGFLPAMYVEWGDGTKLATTFVSSTVLTVVVPAQLVAAPGNSQVLILTSGNYCNTSCYSQPVPVRIGTFSMRLVKQGATDLVWDSARNLIHCADSFSSTETFFSFDLQTGNVVASYANAEGPEQLSLASDGSYLYALYRGGGQAVRFGMPGFTQATVLSGPMGLSAVAVVPGSPLAVAVSGQGKVAIYDDQTPRPQQVSTTSGPLLFWTLDPGTLYEMDNYGDLYSIPVTSSGLGQPLPLGPSHSNDLRPPLRYDASSNRFYDLLGSSIDLQGVDLRVSPVATENAVTAVDGALGKLFVANQESAYQAMTLRSFDLASGALISRVVLGSQFQSAYRLIRFGTAGLALATYDSVVLYEGPLVQ